MRLKILAAAIRHPMEQMEPMMFGSSGPSQCAVKNQGTVKETAAVRVMGNIPLRALIPLPQMQTIKNGETKVSRHWMMATLADRGKISVPVTEARVTVGTPTEPKAVGVEFTTRQATTVLMGSSPIPTRMEAGMATAVPNPAMPSIKFPNPQPMIRASTRLSWETPASIFLINSMAPVFSVRL